MSNTFTSRPSLTSRGRGSTRGQANQTNPRGAGRGTTPTTSNVRGRGFPLSNQPVSRPSGRGNTQQTSRGAMYNPGARSRGSRILPPRPGDIDRSPGDGNEEGAIGGHEPPSQEQRVSHQGAYSVVAPNEKKRQQITEQARRETEEYERHKAENKPQYVSYHGTVGGGQMTEDQARRQLIQKNANSKYNKLEKQRKHREEFKRQEDSSNEKKKLEARKKAESNERRALREIDKKKDEMERIKNAFLDRFENSGPKAPASSSLSSPPPAIQNLSKSHDQQPHSEPANEREYREQPQPMVLDSSDNMTEEMNSDLQTLQSMFPQYPVAAIAEIYSQNHSLELTAELLSDS